MNYTSKTKPFDLARALAGDKFMREFDRAEPIDWYHFKEINEIVCCFNLHEDLAKYNIHGERYHFSITHKLVMLPKTKKLWIAIFKERSKLGYPHHVASHAYFEKESLIKQSYTESEHDFIEIEVEE